MNTLSRPDAEYLAALIDGEGCIAIVPITTQCGTPNYQLRLMITQANRPYLDGIQKMIGAGTVSRARKGIYQLQLTTKQAASLLRQVQPYLRLKQEQADIAIRFDMTQAKQGGDFFRSGRGGGCLPQHILTERAWLADELRRLHIPEERRSPQDSWLEPEQAQLSLF